MKKIILTAMVSFSLLIWSDRLHAQATVTKLNQVELIKQFAGNWKGEVGKDTTAFWEIKFNGMALECSFKYVTKDKIFMEGKQFWGYDKEIDKFILSSRTEGMDAGTHGLWFISKNKCTIVPLSDIPDPEKSAFKLDTEFRSPDMFIQRTFVNNKIIKTDTFNRIKN